MIYLIAKGKFKEMDAIKVDIDTLEDPIYSFLSINFGFIADVDINSEFMRCLGELRFELYGIYRAICQKNYRAKIWTSTDQNTVLPEINEPIEGMEDKIFRLFIMHNMAYLSKSYMSAPLCKIDDGYIDY
jgi:sphingosine kinase